MKAKHSRRLICLIVVLLICGCGNSSSKDIVPETMTHQLYIDVDFEGNLLLDCYDVDVVFDDQTIGTIPHGEYFTKLLSDVEEGDHSILFHKNKDESIRGEYDITVTKDMTFQCTIHAKGSEVKIDNVNTMDSIEGTSVQMIDVTDMNLEEALDQLKKQGFVNISYKSKNDDIILVESNWTVLSQNIESGTSCDKNENIDLICKHNSEADEEEPNSDAVQGYIDETDSTNPEVEKNVDTSSSYTTQGNSLESDNSASESADDTANLAADNIAEADTIIADSDTASAAEETEDDTINDPFQVVKLGHYGDIDVEWYVLSNEDNKSLLLSKYIIDFQPFNDSTVANACEWGNSSIRSWLNNEFFSDIFSEEEQSAILDTTVQEYMSDNRLGEQTVDKVFFLCVDEAKTYFDNNEERGTTSTEFAKTRVKFPYDSWWLINSYSSGLYKKVVYPDGNIDKDLRVNEPGGIRPALWINNDFLNSTSSQQN